MQEFWVHIYIWMLEYIFIFRRYDQLRSKRAFLCWGIKSSQTEGVEICVGAWLSMDVTCTCRCTWRLCLDVSFPSHWFWLLSGSLTLRCLHHYFDLWLVRLSEVELTFTTQELLHMQTSVEHLWWFHVQVHVHTHLFPESSYSVCLILLRLMVISIYKSTLACTSLHESHANEHWLCTQDYYHTL